MKLNCSHSAAGRERDMIEKTYFNERVALWQVFPWTGSAWDERTTRA